MRLTKDEARILAQALRMSKSKLANQDTPEHTKDLGIPKALNVLEERLEKAGHDERRQGRTSIDDWDALLQRYGKPYAKPKAAKP
jgi:hypothetical protein